MTASFTSLAALDACDEPVEAFKETGALECTRLLDGPLPVLDLWQTQRVRDLVRE